jgi:hypothetical protein
MWKGKVTKTPDTKVIGGYMKELFEGDNPVDWIFIDIGGLGAVIYDYVKELEFGEYVIPVNFGSKKDVIKKERYFNKRAEMIGEMKDWLGDDSQPVKIPDEDDVQADFCGPSYKYDNEQRILIESKEDMKKRGLVSSDLLDAGALTFARPMAKRVTTKKKDQINVLL